MWVTAGKTRATQIADSVVGRVLNMYPEEKLTTRDVFEKAFASGEIEFRDLKAESEKLLIPWQMFLLSEPNLETQLAHIDSQRKDKISEKLISKRPGSGDITSRRIIDRLIRQQNFLLDTDKFPPNSFCGSLKDLRTPDAAKHLIQHFGINRDRLWGKQSKGWALEYFIDAVEAKNINVSRGVLSHKLLPHWRVVPSDVYRNTSGFAIKDNCIPFVFLPGEVNPDEVESRQIYTLLYLLSVVGLDQYDHYLKKDFTARMLTAKGVPRKLHQITMEVLIPASETEALRDQEVTAHTRDVLANKFKVSPSALVTTLRLRKLIAPEQYELLKPAPYVSKKGPEEHRRGPKISTSVVKFCGRRTVRAINAAIGNESITNTQAQYLIFGSINKKGYYKYRKEVGL